MVYYKRVGETNRKKRWEIPTNRDLELLNQQRFF